MENMNVGLPQPQWREPTDSSKTSGGSEQSVVQPQQNRQSSISGSHHTESVSKSSAAIPTQITTIPGLVTPQDLRLKQASPEELLNNTLSNTVDILEEALETLSGQQGASQVVNQSESQQVTVGAKIPIAQFLGVLLKATRDLKEIQQNVEMSYAEKSSALRAALHELSDLESNNPVDAMGKSILLAQLIELRSQARYIATGQRVILGERPDIMLKLVQYGILPPMVTGGPYDGMAKNYANNGWSPYDIPAYAAMAKSLPAGWEELSIGELDGVISKLQDSISISAGMASIGILSSVTSRSMMGVAGLIASGNPPNIVQMMSLRMELENLRRANQGMGFISIANHPEMLPVLQLMGISIQPHPASTITTYYGAAQRAAAAGIPPYDNPVAAHIAQTTPPGWEVISDVELNRVIGQVDIAIDRAVNEAKFYNRVGIPPIFLGEPLRSKTLFTLSLSPFSFGNIIPFVMHPYQFPFVNPYYDLSYMLLDSIAMQQSFFWAFRPFPPFINPIQTAERILNDLVTNRIANRMVQDLFGYQFAFEMERDMIARALVAYALTGTLINAYRLPDAALLNVLTTLSNQGRFGEYAVIAAVIVEHHRQGEIQAVQATIKELAKQLKQDEEQLEELKLLQTLLKQMIAQIFQMLDQTAQGVQEGQSGQTKKGETPTFHRPLQG